jgi:aminoglycoside phosphotransferase family enzyme
MKRLSHSDMLDTRLVENRVTEADVRDIGDLMVRFYRNCMRGIADGDLYPKHLATEHAINRTVLERVDLDVGDAAGPALDAVDRALETLAPAIGQRIADGLVVEGHGDLRPEHVHLGSPVQIIDCLEFNRAMRIVDPYDEINYLGLECAMMGAPWVRRVLLDVLAIKLGSLPDRNILALYGGFRALLRARLCMAHLIEPTVRHAGMWKPLALSYIALAKQEISLPCQPDWKSTCSREGV